MKNKGMTLIELLVVITIAGVLFVALGFAFTGWQGKYKVESQIKDIYGDLMYARINAMQKNRMHFVSLLTTTSYTVHDDDSDGAGKVPDGDGILQLQAGAPAVGEDTRLGSFPKTVEFDIDWNNSAIGAQEDLVFNTRGLATNLGTISIFIDRNSDGTQDFFPDYDCIVISATRINLGQLDVNGTAIRSDDDCTQK